MNTTIHVTRINVRFSGTQYALCLPYLLGLTLLGVLNPLTAHCSSSDLNSPFCRPAFPPLPYHPYYENDEIDEFKSC